MNTTRWFAGTVAAAALIASACTEARAAATQMEASSRTLEIRGQTTGEYFGRPIVCADLNDDGYDDIVVGADRSTFGVGQRPTLFVFRGSRDYADADLVDLSVDQADSIILGDTDSDNLATALAKGDVNDDGIDDIVMADSTSTASGRVIAGIVYVLFGRTNFFGQTTYDLALNQWSVKILGAAAGDDTGGSLLFAGSQSKGLACGDLNNDGIDDIAMGAHLADSNSRTNSGKVLVVFGRNPFTPGTTIDLLTQSNVTILGNEAEAELGTAITIGDLNADNIPDLIMGEEYGSVTLFSTEGRIFVLWGRASWPATYNLLSTAADLTIIGDNTWDLLGSAVALTDFNADGRKDLVATAPGWDPAGVSSTDYGAVYGFLGKASWPATINLGSAAADFFTTATANDQSFGNTIEGADVNKDGIGDFFFSSRDGDRIGFSGEGRTFILNGKAGFPATVSIAAEQVDTIINGGTNNFQLGDTIGSGDIDGDGADEILLAAPFLNSSTGRLLVFDLTPIVAAAGDWSMYE